MEFTKFLYYLGLMILLATTIVGFVNYKGFQRNIKTIFFLILFILLFPPLVKTMHFSARALVIRKNVVILVNVSSWKSYNIKANGSYRMDNEISLSCIKWRYSETLSGVANSTM